MINKLTAAAVLCALALPAAAWAQVTCSPKVDHEVYKTAAPFFEPLFQGLLHDHLIPVELVSEEEFVERRDAFRK